MERKIIKLPLQSFCFGVKNAINETKRIIDNPHINKPIYMLGEIVHNKYVSFYFEEQGIIVKKTGTRLEMLESINEGSVIFTAHGVSSKVYDEAKKKNLTTFNTTCPFVKNSIKLIEKYLQEEYYVLYIGSKNHPESETALTISDKVILIENLLDVEKLSIKYDKLVVTNQTTMSIYDIYHIVEALKIKYPHLIVMEKVCNAAKERQEMIKEIAIKHQNDNTTSFIVIGDKKSHNSSKLASIINTYNKNVFFVENIEDLEFEKLNYFSTIYIASGTSTPIAIVDEIYNALISNITINKSNLKIEDYIKTEK